MRRGQRCRASCQTVDTRGGGGAGCLLAPFRSVQTSHSQPMKNGNPSRSHVLKPIQVNVQRCVGFRTNYGNVVMRGGLCLLETVSGLGQRPRAESCGLGSSAYLWSVSPGVSLGVSETEGLDKEMAGTASVVGLSAGALTGQPQAGATLPPRGQGNKGTFHVSWHVCSGCRPVGLW